MRLYLTILAVLGMLLLVPSAHAEEVTTPLVFVVQQPKYMWCGEVAELFGGNVIDSRLDFSGLAGTISGFGNSGINGMSNNNGQRQGQGFGR